MDAHIAVFFAVEDGAVPVRRRRAGVEHLVFYAHSGQSDADALQGYASQPRYELHFAATDVHDDDELDSEGRSYRVLRALRVNDGQEMHAYLDPVEPAVPWDGPEATP